MAIVKANDIEMYYEVHGEGTQLLMVMGWGMTRSRSKSGVKSRIRPIILLISILTIAFSIQPVKASGTIYIRSNGSVDPSTAPIQRDGDIYIDNNIQRNSDLHQDKYQRGWRADWNTGSTIASLPIGCGSAGGLAICQKEDSMKKLTLEDVKKKAIEMIERDR